MIPQWQQKLFDMVFVSNSQNVIFCGVAISKPLNAREEKVDIEELEYYVSNQFPIQKFLQSKSIIDYLNISVRIMQYPEKCTGEHFFPISWVSVEVQQQWWNQYTLLVSL